ncbi:MAG TPA: cytochrome c oxidase subunit II [Anaerolineales bacterium]|nr:cytochrome c oxidase subunit II [Anaerolineales bacterium]
MKERSILLVIFAALILTAGGYLAATQLHLMPFQASTRAVEVDRLFQLLLGITAVIFLLVEGALVYAALRFRRKPGDDTDAVPVHGNNALEILWTLIPAAIVVFVGIYSVQVLQDIERPQENTLVVEVIGRQFTWEFHYPEDNVTTSELHLPVGRPVLFQITAEDVIHSFWVPEFRAKRDATPGQMAELRITPSQPGRFPIRCAELCGPGHAGMISEVVVEDQAAYDAWLAAAKTGPSDPVEIFTQFGCAACHTLAAAGSNGQVGPPLDGLAATAANRVPGLSAEEYVRQSILEPGAHVVQPFANGLMPADFGQRLTDEQLDALIEFLLAN